MLLLFALLLASCGGKATQQQQEKQAKPEPASDPKLQASYQQILVLPVGIGAQLAQDYPTASADCRAGLVAGLEASKRFQVKPIDKVPAQTKHDTLIVKLDISDMRIASGAARAWAGPFAGSSYINIKMTLTEGQTGRVVRDKDFSTQNNAWAASFTFNDYSISQDMGKTIRDYITDAVPPAASPPAVAPPAAHKKPRSK
jgi:hypothetical protein